MTRTRTALIIGGGIAGPAAAMALQKAGLDPVVYEAHPTGADGVGVFLTLASNGIDALRVLDADKAAVAAGFPTPRITLRSGTGKRLGESRTASRCPTARPAKPSSAPTCTGCCMRRRVAGACTSSTASVWLEPRRPATACGLCSLTAARPSPTC